MNNGHDIPSYYRNNTSPARSPFSSRSSTPINSNRGIAGASIDGGIRPAMTPASGVESPIVRTRSSNSSIGSASTAAGSSRRMSDFEAYSTYPRQYAAHHAFNGPVPRTPSNFTAELNEFRGQSSLDGIAPERFVSTFRVVAQGGYDRLNAEARRISGLSGPQFQQEFEQREAAQAGQQGQALTSTSAHQSGRYITRGRTRPAGQVSEQGSPRPFGIRSRFRRARDALRR